MIRILPLKAKEKLTELNKIANLNEDANLAFCIFENDDSISDFVLYNIASDYGKILAVSTDDDSLVDGMIRAVLASLYDFGINRADFGDKINLPQLRKLHILKENETTILSIKDILYHCTSCHCNNNPA